MEDKPLFSQTFVGALLVAVLAALIVWFFVGRQVVRVEVINAGAITASAEPRSSEPKREFVGGSSTQSETASVRTDQQPRVEGTCLKAVIEDADHYTNIRSGPSTSYEVIARVLEGEVFCITSRKGHWWMIRTAGGVDGYIYYDRVRVVARE